MRQKPHIIQAREIQDDGTASFRASNIGDLKPATVKRHHALNHQLARRARDVWKKIAGYAHVDTQTDFLDGFLYDTHPEKEILIWEGLAEIFTRCVKDLQPDEPSKKSILRLIVTISIKTVDVEGVTGVPPEVLARVQEQFRLATKRWFAPHLRALADDVIENQESGNEALAVLRVTVTTEEGIRPELAEVLELVESRIGTGTPDETAAALRNVADELEQL
jgi:hypothetical protein